MKTITEENQVTTFANLLSTFDIERFKNNYWEKKYYHIKRVNTDFYNSIFNIKNVDEILDKSRPSGGNLRVIKNQEPLPANKYENQDGSLNLNQLYTAYADGYTLVINKIERFWQPLQVLCSNMQAALNHKVVVNMYLTPKNQKALATHYDTHDVFVLQIHGKKHWKLYNADYKTPILNSFQPIFKSEQLSGEKNITVSAGDLLYIPRGVPHEAVTNDESSLHLTIGVYPVQWMDFASKSIHHLAYSNLEFRQALPLGFLNTENQSPEFRQELKDKLKRLLIEAVKNADLDGALQFVAEELRNEEKPIGDGHFAHLDELDSINCNTRLRHRDLLSSKVQSIGNISRIIFPGNVIKGPAHIAPCFSYISENRDGFNVGNIPLINNENKIKLSKRLIRGGLLKIQD